MSESEIDSKPPAQMQAFTFGDPVPVLDVREVLDYVEAWFNGRRPEVILLQDHAGLHGVPCSSPAAHAQTCLVQARRAHQNSRETSAFMPGR